MPFLQKLNQNPQSEIIFRTNIMRLHCLKTIHLVGMHEVAEEDTLPEPTGRETRGWKKENREGQGGVFRSLL